MRWGELNMKINWDKYSTLSYIKISHSDKNHFLFLFKAFNNKSLHIQNTFQFKNFKTSIDHESSKDKTCLWKK